MKRVRSPKPATLLLTLVLAGCGSSAPPTVAAAAATVATAAPTTAATKATAPTVAAACPTANFPDLSTSAGAGASYAKPKLSVTCTATELKVTSNGMISYLFTPKTPNKLSEQNWTWSVPAQPKQAAATTDISQWFGTVGFSVTGIPIYAAMEGAQPTQSAFGDPVYNGMMDSCSGHTGPAGEYHLHAITATASCGFEPSPIVGYALDGFPIYGPNGCLDVACKQVVTFTSGWVKTGNPVKDAWKNYTYTPTDNATVLDQCNGRVGPDGTYRYYATAGFPYTFGCFAGTPTKQTGRAGAPMPPMNG